MVTNTISKSFIESDPHFLDELNMQSSISELDERRNSSVILEEIYSQFKEELVTIVVEIGDGREVPIVVYYGDKAEDLAKGFVQMYRLSTEVIQKLTENIQLNIDQALSKRARSTKLKDSLTVNSTNGSVLEQGVKKEQMKLNTKMLKKDKNSLMSDNDKLRASTPLMNVNKRSKLTPEVISSVQRLYVNAVRKKEQKARINQILKQEKEMENMEWTFKPKIDSLSRKLIETATNHGLFKDRISNNIQKTRQKISELRDTLYLEEKLNCPFKPKVNQNNNIKTLYENTKERKSVQKLGNEYTFHPNINTSQNTLKGIVKFNRIEKKKVSELKPKPKICSPKKKSRNGTKTSIGEYLYLEGKKQINMKMLLQTEAMLKELKEHNKSFVQNNSNRILEKKKRSTFDGIFKTLDQYSNGIISAKTACIQSTLIV